MVNGWALSLKRQCQIFHCVVTRHTTQQKESKNYTGAATSTVLAIDHDSLGGHESTMHLTTIIHQHA